jgi:hypothetical protein
MMHGQKTIKQIASFPFSKFLLLRSRNFLYFNNICSSCWPWWLLWMVCVHFIVKLWSHYNPHSVLSRSAHDATFSLISRLFEVTEELLPATQAAAASDCAVTESVTQWCVFGATEIWPRFANSHSSVCEIHYNMRSATLNAGFVHTMCELC